MAYISTEDVKAIRDDLKKRFPRKEGWKLSVTRRHGSSVDIAFMEAPVNLDPENKENYNVNHLWMDDHYKNNPELLKIFKSADEAVTNVKVQEDYNYGDPGADYCNMNFFYNIQVGKWDKTFIYNAPEQTEEPAEEPAAVETETNVIIVKEFSMDRCTVKTMSNDCFNQIRNYIDRMGGESFLMGDTVESTTANIKRLHYFTTGCFTYIQARAFAEYYHGLCIR